VSGLDRNLRLALALAAIALAVYVGYLVLRHFQEAP
jgi:uncharacterized membrane protein (DUF485 family)